MTSGGAVGRTGLGQTTCGAPRGGGAAVAVHWVVDYVWRRPCRALYRDQCVYRKVWSCWGLPGTTTGTAPAAWTLPPALPPAIPPSIFRQNPCHGSKPFYAGSSSSRRAGSMCRSSKWDCEACRRGHVGTVATAEEEEEDNDNNCGHCWGAVWVYSDTAHPHPRLAPVLAQPKVKAKYNQRTTTNDVVPWNWKHESSNFDISLYNNQQWCTLECQWH